MSCQGAYAIAVTEGHSMKTDHIHCGQLVPVKLLQRLMSCHDENDIMHSHTCDLNRMDNGIICRLLEYMWDI